MEIALCIIINRIIRIILNRDRDKCYKIIAEVYENISDLV